MLLDLFPTKSCSQMISGFHLSIIGRKKNRERREEKERKKKGTGTGKEERKVEEKKEKGGRMSAESNCFFVI